MARSFAALFAVALIAVPCFAGQAPGVATGPDIPVSGRDRVYAAEPAAWQRDDSPEGFRWIDAGNSDQNVLSFARVDATGRPGLVCVANLSPVVHHNFRVGLPRPGRWLEVVNTDAESYGGSGVGNLGSVVADATEWNGQPHSAALTLPPLAVLWLAPDS